MGADTVIVPGTAAPDAPLSPAVRDALRRAAADGTRIASIRTGAFPLAAAGLLDGLRPTTHWVATGQLSAAHPDIDVGPNVLHVDNGQILASAGAAAGLNLCLHLIHGGRGSRPPVRDAAGIRREVRGVKARFVSSRAGRTDDLPGPRRPSSRRGRRGATWHRGRGLLLGRSASGTSRSRWNCCGCAPSGHRGGR